MTAALARVDNLTPAQVAQQRASARALLAVEKRTLDAVRRDLSDTTDSLIADIGRQPDRDSDAGKAAILALLLLAGGRLRNRLRERTKAARRTARTTALERFGSELGASGLALGAVASLSKLVAPRTHLDHARASGVADTLAAAWQAGTLYNLSTALDAGRSPERAADLSAELLDPRLRKLAATEVPQAYNDEHRRIGDDVAELLDDDEGAGLLYEGGIEGAAGAEVAMLVRRWDAILDMRACVACREHNGEVVPLGSSFEGNEEPGFMHPWCRCIDTVIAIPRMRIP